MRKILVFLFLIAITLGFTTSTTSAQETNDCDDGFRAVEHALGTACVPDDPQRVVALDTAITEVMLLLDQPQIIASDIVLQTYMRMHPELVDTYATIAEDLPDVGFPPNIEVILEAQPDLIIAPDDIFSRSIYEQVADTVPMVVYDSQPGQWRERLLLAGNLLNETDAVDTLLADYDARVTILQTQLGDNAAATNVSLVRTFPGQIGLVLTGTMAQSVLDEVGLSRPESQDVSLDYVANELGGRPEILISEEELLAADGDVVFVFGDGEELFANPLWNALPAARDGRVYEVGYYWWGDSLLSAHDMLDDLFEYVAGVEPATVAPNPFEDGLASPAAATDDCDVNFRPVEHARGMSCVPNDPQRIAALDLFTFEAMVALEAPMIATPAVYIDELVAKFPQFEPALAEVTDVGIPFNFEALLAVNPDVILCRQTACDDSYDALSEIAPTIVFANESSADWQASARFFAQAINMTDAIDALEADYAERIEVFEAALVDAFGAASPTVSVLRVLPERLRLYFGESFAGIVLQDAGLQYPSAQQALAEESEFGSQLYQLSIEELPLIDADFVFVYVTDRLVEGQAEAYLDELQSDPLWQALPAVRNERLFVVGNYWFAAGYIAAHAIIDDLFAIVLNMEPPLANPFTAEAETRAE